MNEASVKYLVEFFASLDLLAPADPDSTRRALKLVPLGANSVIVDAGCGTGRQTLQLLEETRSHIIAVDLETALLDGLWQRAESRGLAHRLSVEEANMLSLPFSKSSVDLIYCEGAVYNVGLESALDSWRPLLKTGGHVCFSDAAYSTEDPPAEVRAFWEAEYPGISRPEHARQVAIDKGYDPVDFFWMPSEGWEAYYTPVAHRIEELAEAWAEDETGLQVLESIRNEVSLYKRHGSTYGYYFMILQKGSR